jgi:hypothetical protein
MTTSLIQLADGILVEVDVRDDQARPISGGLARRVAATIEKVIPILAEVGRSVAEASAIAFQDKGVCETEVEVGLSFEAEGQLYIARSQAAANLVVRMSIRPDGPQDR